MNRIDPLPFAASRNRLVLHCLGRPRLVSGSGTELPIRTRKARALLVYLALNSRPISRAQLTCLLWSDRGEDQARASLRQTLFELRQAAGDWELLQADRECLQLNGDSLVTDVTLLEEEANCGTASSLADRLALVDVPILSDLDGLDPEFDSWLRLERSGLQTRVAELALAGARRLRESASTAAECIPVIAEALRVEPANEAVARFAMRLDAEANDMAALHRRYRQLRAALSEECGAEPSAATAALFDELTSRIQVADTPRREAVLVTSGAYKSRGRWMAIATILLLLIVGAAHQFAWGPSRAGEVPVVVAVLPFEQQPKDGSFLAEGLWEHTRAALSRNNSLRVLGRSTTAAMVERRLSPQQFAERLGVTHLLEGTVRRNSDGVVVSVNLSRAKDGVTIWHEMYRGRMGQPLDLQDAIANGIEGKLRGRLARSGGRRAEHIATMPEVYGLYSEARQLITSREQANVRRAEVLLRKAVAMDANYAPAWSLLGAAIYFNGRVAIVDSRVRAAALAAVRKALGLAPNLAQAHATLAMLAGGASVTAERSLRRAVALDPNYAEAWNWLGNALNSQHRPTEAAAAYERALAIDPLLESAIANLGHTASDLGDSRAYSRLVERVRTAGGGEALLAGLESTALLSQGDYSGSIRVLKARGLDQRGVASRSLWSNWFESLTAIGLFDELHAITGCPDWYAPLLRGDGLPPASFDGRPVVPEEFWTSIYFSTPASRALVRNGRGDQLVSLYRRGFADADAFISETRGRNLLFELAPVLAVALAAEGKASEGAYILAAAANDLQRGLTRPRPSRHLLGQLALVRAAQSERDQALRLLAAAIDRGWMPDGRAHALDLADEPAWKPFAGDPGFERLRRRIVAHITRERNELGQLQT